MPNDLGSQYGAPDRRPWTWQEEYGFHQGHEVVDPTRTLYLSGQVSLGADGNPVHVGDMAGQIRQVIDNIEVVLAEAGMSLADIVRINIFTTDMDLFFEHADELERLREAGTRYTSTLVGVTRLAFSEFLVEIEATAAR